VYFLTHNVTIIIIFVMQVLFMVGCGLLRPVPKKARSDTPKKLKQLCIDCCKVSRDDRPTFDFVSVGIGY